MIGAPSLNAIDGIIHDSLTGVLSYNSEGNGEELAQVLVVLTGLLLTEQDFVIV